MKKNKETGTLSKRSIVLLLWSLRSFKRGPVLEDQTFLFGIAQCTTKSSFSFQLSGLWRCNWYFFFFDWWIVSLIHPPPSSFRFFFFSVFRKQRIVALVDGTMFYPVQIWFRYLSRFGLHQYWFFFLLKNNK